MKLSMLMMTVLSLQFTKNTNSATVVSNCRASDLEVAQIEYMITSYLKSIKASLGFGGL